jgi:hypothetical protein
MTLRLTIAPPDDILVIDISGLKFLVDLPEYSMMGMRPEHDGYPAVRSEILANQSKLGVRAGVSSTDFDQFKALDDQHAQVRVQLPRVTKAREVLEKTLAYIDDQRHKVLTTITKAAERHAKTEGGDALTTAYAKSIAYRGISANKGLKTKQKNAEAKKAQGATGATGPTGPTAKAPRKSTKAESKIPNAPPDSIYSLDITAFKGILVDLPAGALVGMRTEQPGWDGAFNEIVTNQPKYGVRAGVLIEDLDRLKLLNQQFKQIRDIIPTYLKAQEVLKETLAYLADQREKLISSFAESVKDHAAIEGGDPTLLTAYQQTTSYAAAPGTKAALTRRRNEAKRNKGGSGPTGPGGGGGTGGTGATGPNGTGATGTNDPTG